MAKTKKPVPLHTATKKPRPPKSFFGRKLLTADEWNLVSIWVRDRLDYPFEDILLLAMKEKPIQGNRLSVEVISEAIARAERMPKQVNSEQHRLF